MRLVMLLCVCLFLGCSCRPTDVVIESEEAPAWFLSHAPAPRGVFVLTHGLNQRPSSLNAMATFLASLGFHVRRITLKGHEREEDDLFPESAWRADVAHGVRDARQRFPGLPLSMMGYSLGGLLTVDAIASDPSLQPVRAILLAPAISLRPIVQAVEVLTLFPDTTARTPNLAPTGYRRFSSTPLFWYSNTARLYEQNQHPERIEALRSVPTLILVSPADELVSPSGLASWVEDNGLSATWQIERVRPNPTHPQLHEHLIIDQVSLGQDEWLRTQQMIRSFIDEPAGSRNR